MLENVAEMIERVREELDIARAYIDNKPGGTTQDARLLRALELLTSTVEAVALRDDQRKAGADA